MAEFDWGLLKEQLKKQRAPLEREAPGLHPVEVTQACTDASHAFPTHLYIPPGHKYVHYCPRCGAKSVAFGSSVTF